MMLFPEVERRRALNKDVLSYNPFTLYSLDETTTPSCEPTCHSAGEALEVMTLDKGMTDGQCSAQSHVTRVLTVQISTSGSSDSPMTLTPASHLDPVEMRYTT